MASRVNNAFHTKRDQGSSFCKKIPARAMIKPHVIRVRVRVIRTPRKILFHTHFML